jgi:TonB family protein
MPNPRDGADILEKAARYCDSTAPPDDACAEAYDWYGMTLQVDIKPETLRKVEPLYRRALELRQGDANNPSALALSLELEALVLFDPADAPRAQLMRDRAHELRASSVQALQARPVVLSSTPLVSPGPIYKVGGGVVAPATTYKLDPSYSEEARLLKWSGTVRFSVVVDASGRARSIQLVKALGFGLDEKAMEALQKWVFRPGTKDGSPVNVAAQIDIFFRLL